MAFKDHFSKQAQAYSEYRPNYPADLIEYLSALTPVHDLAWDCATGNGQVAIELAEQFRRVKATDASAEQIARGLPHPGVEYSVGLAEQPEIDSASVDLITIAQALHWFDQKSFYVQVERVLKPTGLVAAWCYGVCHIHPRIDAVVHRLYEQILGEFWPEDRLLVESLYAGISFPFAEIPPRDFVMRAAWRCSQFTGYLSSWSAVQRYRERNGTDPLALVEADLRSGWGDQVRTVTWPMGLRVGRVEGRKFRGQGG